MKRLSILFVLLLCFSGCGQGEKQENHEFTFQGISIIIGGDATSVIDALGEPNSYTEAASCAFDGLEKTYHYDDFSLVTYPADQGDQVARIWFSGKNASTDKGLSVGTARAAAEQLYGPVSGNHLSVYQGNSILTILLEDDIVTSIQYALVIE